ncbi:MAG: amidase family protein [Pseudomonadota bacterium]
MEENSILEATIDDLQKLMENGSLTSYELVKKYLTRIEQIDKTGVTLCSIIEINPDLLDIAKALDKERKEKGSRGLLHGIPILLKDNIDTKDKMLTTAGSWSMVGSIPEKDATVALKLRDAGGILFGKANMSEWANYRSSNSSNGWSGRGGQTKNPYHLAQDPCGSSTGSAVAVSANLVAVSLGTETSGSIICPSATCGVVGIKPTVGLVSRAGVIPISHNYDTVGPITRTVADAAVLLSFLTGIDTRDRLTQESNGKYHTDYCAFLDENGLQGIRVGFIGDFCIEFENMLQENGAQIIKLNAVWNKAGTDKDLIFSYDFKNDISQYLAKRQRNPAPQYTGFPMMHTLEDIIAFNKNFSDLESTIYDQRKLIDAMERGPLTDQCYIDQLNNNKTLSRKFIDDIIEDNNLDVIVGEVPANLAGYPVITIPIGLHQTGMPKAFTFTGRAYSEPTLIRIAYAIEHIIKGRTLPKYLTNRI